MSLALAEMLRCMADKEYSRCVIHACPRRARTVGVMRHSLIVSPVLGATQEWSL
jgi:hypothetical protein